MGRSSSTSTSSCLKIIACGTNTAADDDDDNDNQHTQTQTQTQTKAPADKRGWSFRKRSSRHRVLGNNPTSETPNFTDKDLPQVSTADLQAPLKSSISDEKPDLPKAVVKFSEVPGLQFDGEPKPSMEVPHLDYDFRTASETPKVSQVMVASDDDNDSTPSEPKMSDAVSVPESGTPKPSADPITATDSVVLEVESDKMAESRTSDSEVAPEDGTDASLIVDEAVALIIQTAIRGCLAQKGFEQLKSAVTLQAVIRGHLVRQNAVNTLHCIRGISKIQALVRARSSKSLDKDHKPSGGQFSTAKLLQNSFARQLLESTPKSRSVNIRCDPLTPNSTWVWLEKWMSITTCEVENVEPSANLLTDDQVVTNHEVAEAGLSSTALPESLDFRFASEEMTYAPESEENNNEDIDTADVSSSLTTLAEEEQILSQMAEVTDEDVNSIEMVAKADEVPDLHAECIPLPEKSSSEIQQPKLSRKLSASEELNGDLQAESILLPEKTVIEIQQPKLPTKLSASEELNVDLQAESILLPEKSVTEIQQPKLSTVLSASEELDGNLHAESILLPEKSVLEIQQPKLSTKRSASEELNGEGKKFSYGARKSSNPDFLATQSKFEELTSSIDSGKSNISAHQVGTETNVDPSLTLEQSVKQSSDVGVVVPFDPHIIVADSECGTELSVSSTLDSPDRCERENERPEPETKAVEISPDPGSEEGLEYDTSGILSNNHISDLPSQIEEEEEVQAVNGIDVSPVGVEVSPQVEQKAEINESSEADFTHVGPVTDGNSPMDQKQDLSELSPAASPNSHMTVTESQGTPSSQVSVKSKKKVDKSGSNAKRTSLSAGKRSPNPKFDLGVRISVEHSPKDHKSGKRRNSFGSTKSENTDQEPRDSSSNVSLPSYMQATKSARAKAHSPRSSPDVHDKEVNSKKRHSLPGAGGRQGSPRVQRSTSQAAQGVDGNGSNPSNERKWQR